MITYLCEWLWHDGAWRRDARLTVDDAGLVSSLDLDSDTLLPPGATRVSGLALPGLVNAHSHAFQRALAGLTEIAGGDDDFWTWREAMYAFVARATPDDVHAIAALLYSELLEGGYTRVGEFHYLHHDPSGAHYADPAEMSLRLIAAASDAGMGLTLLPSLYQTAGFDAAPLSPRQRRFECSVDWLLGLLERIEPLRAAHPGLALGVAPHSLRAVQPAALVDLITAVRERDPELRIHLHVAEQEREVAACVAARGARPVAWLCDHVEVDAGYCLVHATHLEPGEVAAIAASGATVALCPTTEANLGDGIAPAEALLAQRVPIALGGDSHVGVRASDELRWLEYGQRLKKRTRNVLAPRGQGVGAHLYAEVLVGGHRSLGAPAPLAPGSPADLVVLDADHPSLAGLPPERWLDAWVFAQHGSPVQRVLARGRWVVEGGRHVERDALRARYRDVTARLAGA